MMVDTTTFNPIPEDADRQQAAEIAKIMMATRGLPREEGEIEDTETMSTEDFMLNEYFKPKREELMENFGLSIEVVEWAGGTDFENYLKGREQFEKNKVKNNFTENIRR
jgi:hypothetical protein